MITRLLRHEFHKRFTVRFPDRSEWERGPIPVKKGGLNWHTNEGTGSGMYSRGMRQRCRFSLWQCRILKRTMEKEHLYSL
jgi:hypothetical protein